MKKYIIIAGVPRAGKSTLTSIISKQLGYQHICFDTINYALEQNMIEPKINTNNRCRDDNDMMNKLVKSLSKIDISKVVIDLRYNGGGNN